MSMTMTVRASVRADRGAWGAPAGVTCVWVARSRFHEISYPVGDRIRLSQSLSQIDDPDRHEIVGSGNREPIEAWMASTGMEILRRAVRCDGMVPDDDHSIEVINEEYTIKAGPCGSGKYLFIMAWGIP